MRVGVPEGSCAGTGTAPVATSVSRDSAARETGVCPVCGGRFRLGTDSRIPNHSTAPPKKR